MGGCGGNMVLINGPKSKMDSTTDISHDQSCVLISTGSKTLPIALGLGRPESTF